MTDEERAEEYADDTRIIDENTRVGDDCISLVQDFEGNTLDIHERIKRAFLDGFHADRWYYPSRGEYPPKEQEYFVAFKTSKEIYYDVRVLNSGLNNLLLGIGEQIYAWQYIVPPQEEV